MRSDIDDDGLPTVDELLIDRCRGVIRETFPRHWMLGKKSGSAERENGENLDIFIDHYNVSVMIEANLTGEGEECLNVNSELNRIENSRNNNNGNGNSDGIFDRSPPRIISKKRNSDADGLKSQGSSFGELTMAKISTLPGFNDHRAVPGIKNAGNSSGGSVKGLRAGSSKDRMSPSTRSLGYHVSMDSLRRRSMMETRISDEDDFDDRVSIISSISENVQSGGAMTPTRERSNDSKNRERRERQRSRKVCICGAYRARREKSKPSNYRYYDDDGNCIITESGKSIDSGGKEAPTAIVEEEDGEGNSNMEEDEGNSLVEEKARDDSSKKSIWSQWFR